MATLHENTLKYNQKMTVTNTGGNLSTDAGLVLIKEFLHSIGFEQLMEKELHFQDSRLLPTPWIPGTPNYKKTKNNHKALI